MWQLTLDSVINLGDSATNGICACGRFKMIGSKTSIDRLGLRLKHGDPGDDDLKALDAYRRSFEPGYETVIGFVRDQLRLESTGRPAKSTTSVIDKLRRESIRLSQIQDIAGCRVIVPDLAEQERVVGKLSRHFVGSSVVDRRANPSPMSLLLLAAIRSKSK